MISDKRYNGKAPRRRNHLMLIGIDKYEQWKPLAYPVSDCEAFFQVLQKHYGFTREDLLHVQGKPLCDGDATWDLIYEELSYPLEKDEFGNVRIGTDDNLTIYFAGHGYLDETINEGYWIPVDAPALIKDTPLLWRHPQRPGSERGKHPIGARCHRYHRSSDPPSGVLRGGRGRGDVDGLALWGYFVDLLL